MIKRKFIVTLLLSNIFCFSLSAQSILIQRADRQFNLFHYAKASALYEKYLLEDTLNPQAIQKLSNSYRMMNKTEKAEKWYATLMQLPERKHEDMYYYAQVLKANGKYKESVFWMNTFADSTKTDARAIRFLSTNDKNLSAKDPGKFEIKNLSINNEAMEFGPAFHDSLIIFSSSRGKDNFFKAKNGWDNMLYLNMYMADISSNGELENPRIFSENLSTKFHEGPTTFNKDNNKIFFTRNYYKTTNLGFNNDRTNNLVILSAEKKNGTWTNEQQLSFNNKDYSVGHPSLSHDGKKIYFSSNMPGGFGGSDIYVCEWQDTTWGSPINLGENVNTEENEFFPFIHQSGILFFASDGHIGLGGLDLFMSTPFNEEFITVNHLGNILNSSKDDFSLIVSNDGKSGYFSSNRTEGKGNDDLYYFKTDIPLGIGLILKGFTIEKNLKDTIKNASVALLDEDDKIISEIQSGENGEFSFIIEPNKLYTLNAKKTSYQNFTEMVATYNLNGKKEVSQDILLEKIPAFALYGLITDKKTQEKLDSVHIIISDDITGKEFINVVTDSMGDFTHQLTNKQINDSLILSIKLKKEGYLSKTANFEALITKPGIINLHEKLDIALDKIEVGTDIGKIIDIQPIYFDVNKSIIRSDAALELDKIVKVMTENPNMVIELGSHTDSRGSDEYNLSLSEKRAKSSANYVIQKGIDKVRINGKGFGETKLINHCSNGVKCSSKEHQKNRRTEFIIVEM